MTRQSAVLNLSVILTLAGCASSSRRSSAAPASPRAQVIVPAVRKIAITFDDLPAVAVPAGQTCDLEALKNNIAKLLDVLASHQIPTVGFVNEGRICKSLGSEELGTLLGVWLDRNQELGNHTYSHVDLDVATIEGYEADIIRGEMLISRLLSERGGTLRYFRYPFLNTGRNEDTKRAIASFLAGRGYTVAPVTMSGNGWMFAAVYADAKERGDSKTMELVAEAYVLYMRQVFNYFEAASSRLFGREINQILLLHANALNADYLGTLIEMLQSRGCKFVTLAEALQDPAYGSPDSYVGSGGYSSILRWAQTMGVSMAPRPAEPSFIRKLYAEKLTR
jgi:peptidoglycan/xylan/chitin deacetylase (PgdA/CDA1 family)